MACVINGTLGFGGGGGGRTALLGTCDLCTPRPSDAHIVTVAGCCLPQIKTETSKGITNQLCLYILSHSVFVSLVVDAAVPEAVVEASMEEKSESCSCV